MKTLLLLCCVLVGAPAADWSWVFLAGDGDRNGHLDREELGGLVAAVNPLSPEGAKVDRLLKLLDRDGDGRLSHAEVGFDSDTVEADPQPADLRLLRDIPYLGGASQRDGLQMLDCYIPAEATEAPVLVFVHGGGWSIGDKRRLNHKLTWWCEQGGIVVSVNYRLSPAVSHPAHIEDVAAAVAWVLDHIAEHGGDPQRVFIMGHSAGAHLAALIGADARRLAVHGKKPSQLAGIILLDGAGYLINQRMRGIDPQDRVAKMYTNAFTTDKAVQDDASPVLRMAEAAEAPPPYCLTFSAWRKEAREQVALLQQAVEAAGGRAVSQGFLKNHMSMNTDAGKDGDRLTAFIQAFVDSSSE